MNILTNICNPKEQHFEQEARTQAYKPIAEYVFQNRSMERMRARHEPIQNPEDYKYQSWNHPYSISNFFMNQKGAINGQNKQSLGGNAEYTTYQNEPMLSTEDRNGNKKISFKEIPQALCGIGKQQEQGQKLFTKRQDFYSSLRSNDQTYGKGGFSYQGRNYAQDDNYLIQSDNARFSRIQNLQNDHLSSQNSHAYVLLSQQILRLKQQNKQLKRIIEQEYKPMKELYKKLLSEQEEREYLISKLEWKVKELVKEMGAASGSFGTTGQVEQNNNFETKRETKMMSRVDSKEQFIQNLNSQPFKTFETNFANIKIPQSKPQAYSNFQSPYQNTGINNTNEPKPYGQFNYTPANANNTYQRASIQHSGQQTYQSPQLNTQLQFNSNAYQNSGNTQTNHYISAGTNNFQQANNFSIQSNNVGQNYQKPVQNFQINPSFNHPGYQAHYQSMSNKFTQ